METHLTIHTDGGARGNPGPAAVGVVINKNDALVHEFGKTIGETTNNVAEYTAVIEALKWVLLYRDSNLVTRISFFLDSLLVVNQLNGIFKIKDQKLRELSLNIKILEQEIGEEIKYCAIPREKNKRADFLVNQALDSLASGYLTHDMVLRSNEDTGMRRH